jgi:hypothetical protein
MFVESSLKTKPTKFYAKSDCSSFSQITIPTMYMGINPLVTQKAVDHTYISLYNIRVMNWSYTQVNPTNTCEPYFPNFMNVVMDVQFSKLPWYAMHFWLLGCFYEQFQ